MFTIALAAVALAPASLPKLSIQGMDLVDPKGQTVQLKGCNLGNWLVIEPWMLAMWDEKEGFRDQYELEQILKDRFGNGERERLMDLYRSSWITERDFPIVRSFGFNVVRLPMNYRLMEDDEKPFHLRTDAWQWIDRAVDLAEKNGLYTILDMHGAQGGQSEYDHTGRVGQNKLWSVPQNQERLAWLWGEIAKRYRSRSAVIAYDIFNEPYGGTHKGQKAVFEKALKSIRQNDPDKMVYAHGHYDGFEHYGDPKTNGWRNVAFQMHYYPGLFGNGAPTLETHAKHLRSIDQEIAPRVAKYNVPFLVGEMNVVFPEAGGASMMRRTYDAHANHHWATTMWSYKVLSAEGGTSTWGMVSNRKPARKIDVRTASKEEIENWMRGFATDEYVIYEDLRQMLTAKDPLLPPLPDLPIPIESVSHQDEIPGWTVVDLGGSRKGGLEKTDAGFTLFGGGHDIWGTSDQGRFLYRQVSGDFDLTVNLEGLPPIEQYAKAGLMARESLDADSPAWLLSVFPGGEIQFASREKKREEMAGTKTVEAEFPVRLRLVRSGSSLTAYHASGREPWQEIAKRNVSGSSLYVGAIALSHDDKQLIPVRYSRLQISQ
jgi:glucan 1,3-beta-glucosidase